MLVRRSVLAALALLVGLGAGPASAAEPRKEKDPTHASGLPIPRFVTLRVGEINLRSGPNGSYPIDWVFTRKDMPVEIVQEFDTWRRIRDWEGSEGWVHQSALSGKRGALVVGPVRTLRKAPQSDGPVVARVEAGVIGSLKKCQGDWCEIDIKGYRGWLQRADFWGSYPGEKIE
ncbi:SH3 domain-containing protein [Azospirillum doebereinerae]